MCKFSDNFDGYYEDQDNGILVYPAFDEVIKCAVGVPTDFTNTQDFICYAVVYKGEKYIIDPEIITHDFGETESLVYHELDEKATAQKINKFIQELMLEK